MEPKPFGDYIRQRRVAAGLTLRSLAESIGVSHVYLGGVERGVRAPLAEERWPALLAALPSITKVELEQKKRVSRPLQLDISDAPPEYQNLALALARRIERKDMEPDMMNRLLEMLGTVKDE